MEAMLLALYIVLPLIYRMPSLYNNIKVTLFLFLVFTLVSFQSRTTKPILIDRSATSDYLFTTLGLHAHQLRIGA